MINLNFNSLCPFCNSKFVDTFTCKNCTTIHNFDIINFYYLGNNLHMIKIYFHPTDPIFSIHVDFYDKYISYYTNKTYKINIQNFDSINDLLNIINLYELFS